MSVFDEIGVILLTALGAGMFGLNVARGQGCTILQQAACFILGADAAILVFEVLRVLLP